MCVTPVITGLPQEAGVGQSSDLATARFDPPLLVAQNFAKASKPTINTLNFPILNESLAHSPATFTSSNSQATLSSPGTTQSTAVTPLNIPKTMRLKSPTSSCNSRPATPRYIMTARRTDLCIQSCVASMVNSCDEWLEEQEECGGFLWGGFLRCNWGMLGLLPKVVGGTVSLVDAVCCGCFALTTSMGFCCDKTSCLGRVSLACCILACDSLRVSGIATASLCSDICCGVPSFCCDRFCDSDGCSKVEMKCCRAAGHVLLSGLGGKHTYSRVEHLDEILVRNIRDSIPMQMVREASGIHLFREKMLRAHQRTGSAFVLPERRVTIALSTPPPEAEPAKSNR